MLLHILGIVALMQAPHALGPDAVRKSESDERVSTAPPPVRRHRALNRSAKAQQPNPERDAVRRAVSDYVEGFYEGDSAKLARSLRPELAKYGFWRPNDSTAYKGEPMSFAEAIAYANRFKAAKRVTPADAPREITIYEVQNQTASAKLRASWGTDYLLLGKFGGRWMISHVLWQSPEKR